MLIMRTISLLFVLAFNIPTLEMAWAFSSTQRVFPTPAIRSTSISPRRQRSRFLPPSPTAMYEKGGDSVEDGSNKGDEVEERGRATLTRLITRVINNFWFLVSAPYTDLRKLTRKRSQDNGGLHIALRLRDAIFSFMAYMGVGVLAYHKVFEHWSFVDSLYFTCVCFSTVGYGDLVPQTVGGKIFTCFFGFTGIALLGAAIATIGSKLVQTEVETIQLAQRESRKQLLKAYDRMPKLLTSLRRANKKEQNKIIKEARKHLEETPIPRLSKAVINLWKGIRWIGQSLLVVLAGGLILGKLEGWNTADSLYYALITASTIGLGDFAPTTRAGRMVSVLFIPLTVAAAGEILASAGLFLLEHRQKRIFDAQLAKGLTMDHLKTMDRDHDGKVRREEYTIFMLMQMGLVSENEVNDLSDQFDRLDVTESGYLNQEDLMLMAKLRDIDGDLTELG